MFNTKYKVGKKKNDKKSAMKKDIKRDFKQFFSQTRNEDWVKNLFNVHKICVHVVEECQYPCLRQIHRIYDRTTLMGFE